MKLDDWLNGAKTPVGIGVDAVTISELQKLDGNVSGAFTQRTYTENELREADNSHDRWSYLAGRFAVKEAVFKALAHLTEEKAFDYRIVETLTEADGSPRIMINQELSQIMNNAGADTLLVSITNEGGYAVAMVQATKQQL